MTTRNLCSLLLALSACGSVDAGSSDGSDHTDDQPPDIVEINPPGDNLVEEDVSIAIRFSEPMDQAAVEAAIEFPGGAPTFTWDQDGSQVTVAGLVPYPDGSDPQQLAARQFQVVLGAGATDLAGEPLAGDLTLHYTLRYKRMTQVFPFSQTLSGNCFEACAGTWTWLAAGEHVADFTAAARGFLTIPFDSLPDGVVIDAAVLHSEIEVIDDNPFGWGNLYIDDIEFAAIDGAAYAVRGPGLGVLYAGTPAPAVGAAVSLDVTGAFADDVANRVARQNRTQFRIRFPHGLAEDPSYESNHSDDTRDLVQLLRAETDLTVTYLVE